MAEGKKTITLTHPIEVGGAQVSQIAMRRPLVGDFRAAQRSAGPGAPAADVEIALFSNLCEIAPAEWDKMDLGDYYGVQEEYQDFLSRRSTSAPQGSSSPTSSTSRSR